MSSKAKAKGKSDPNKTSQKVFQKETFIERQWTEETKGDYDNDGFFVTPNGSFWDPDGVYFNKDTIQMEYIYQAKDGMRETIVMKAKLKIMMNMIIKTMN